MNASVSTSGEGKRVWGNAAGSHQHTRVFGSLAVSKRHLQTTYWDAFAGEQRLDIHNQQRRVVRELRGDVISISRERKRHRQVSVQPLLTPEITKPPNHNRSTLPPHITQYSSRKQAVLLYAILGEWKNYNEHLHVWGRKEVMFRSGFN